MADRPAEFLACADLARELSMSESTVYEMVRRGVIPPPYKLSAGCVRWNWPEVKAALASLKAGSDTTPSDPYLAGAQNATKAQAERRRHDA